MLLSDLLPHTLREAPAEAEVPSHRLMIRAGLIRRHAAGIYSWLPIGLRVLRKAERIVREEMERIGAVELLMPCVQPAELWHESGRWQKYGPELLRMTDRREREFCFGPTHEEIITDLIRNVVSSHRQLPLTLFQIQTKFRDEVRPRFGIMRAREFLMKDAYSFHLDEDTLAETYTRMREAYERILERIGLDYRVVEADNGAIGGNSSHEFHVLADAGEDTIVYAPQGQYAANLELARAQAPEGERPAPGAELEHVPTPNARTIPEVAKLLKIPAERCVKTLIVQGSEAAAVALVLRGDHELNHIKAARLAEVASPLVLLDAEAVEALGGLKFGSIGPVGLEMPVIADRDAAILSDFCCGANKPGEHYIGVNWDRDVDEPAVADLRLAREGDTSPDGQGTLAFARGIEVGHVFELGTRYSEAMGAVAQDDHGAERPLSMGCYGFGVSRVVAAAIEQSHDKRGIIWPAAIAPFDILVVPVGHGRSADMLGAAERLHDELEQAGFEVVLDDRALRPGVMFKDAELLGIPHRLVLSERSLEQGMVEYRARTAESNEDIPRERIADFLRERMHPPE
ncbi:MAG: proline--tRNA ligase [Gammaproteobacteria bacterium]|nr:proline--tRNA ligase [Gammaproteobacteria bacterium]